MRQQANQPQTVLVLRFSSAGDIVLTGPAIAALKVAWPRTHIIFATKQAFIELAQALPGVDSVVGLGADESTWHLRERLRRLSPGAVLDLHGKVRSWLLRSLVARRWRARWQKREWFQSLRVRVLRQPYRARMHIATRYHQAVERLVGRSLPRQPMAYAPSKADLQAAEQLLQEAGIQQDAKLVGMAPGAMWETKRWPTDRFADLAKRLLDAGHRVLLTGSPAERELTRAITAQAPAAIDLAGKLRLGTLGAVIGRCDLFVSNDSGPLHIARAQKVPTVAFFGSTDPAQFDFTGHALMFRGLPCSPCSFHGYRRCPRKHTACLLDIQVPQAWRAVNDLLMGPPAPPCTG